jgi:hypothetical protein
VRISVTDLDAYLYWREHEEMDLDALRVRLLRQEPTSIQMALGTALHKAAEGAEVGAFVISADVPEFPGISLAIERQLVDEPWPVRECKFEVPVDVNGVEVTLVGKLDGTNRVIVRDIKTTSRFDPEKLFDTYQWRFYLWMTGATRFVWDVFEIADPLQRAPNVYRVVGQHRLQQWAYPGMETDCRRLLQEFCTVVRAAVPEYPAPRLVEVAA